MEARRLCGVPSPARRHFSCTLRADRSETLGLTLDSCRQRSQDSRTEPLLELIVEEWPAGQGSDVVSLVTALRSIETTYGVKVTVRRKRVGLRTKQDREASDGWQAVL